MLKEELIRLEDLGKYYLSAGKQLQILEQLQLTVLRGQSVAITGKSGSGKSTLLNIIGTLDRPTSGTFYFEGIDTATYDDQALSFFRNQKIGFVFQSHHLLEDFTALENVAIPALIAKVPKRKAMQRATLLLERVGLSERLKHVPSRLSGGERQRIAICRALMNDPPLLIADEPTGSLDEQSAAEVADLLFALVAEEEKTLLLVSHDRQTASRCAHTYLLSQGHLRSLE